MKHILLSIPVSFLAAGIAFGAAHEEMASQEDLTAALTGNTFQGDMAGGAYTGYFGDEGMYRDGSGSGTYEITDDGVCYPDTDFGCFQAKLDGETLTWSQNGEEMGSGTIVQGNPNNF